MPLRTSVAERKLFVRGFRKGTADMPLKCFFSQFGPVILCSVIPNTVRGQLIFESAEGVNRTLAARPLYYDGCLLQLSRESPSGPEADNATSRTQANNPVVNAPEPQVATNERKLMIEGLPAGIAYGVLRTYFSKFGQVAFSSVDKKAGTKGYVVFTNPATVEVVLANQPHSIRGEPILLRRPVASQAEGSGLSRTSTSSSLM